MTCHISAFPSLLGISFAVLMAAPAAFPQLSRRTFDNHDLGGGRVSGEITCATCDFRSITVEIVSGNGRRSGRAYVGVTGSFELPDVGYGTSELRVLSGSGDVLYRQFVTLPTGVLRIKLGPEKTPTPASATVSLARLARRIPEKAVKEFERSIEARKKGKLDESVARLQKALEIAPDYMEARNNLGVQYLQQERYPEALEQFQAAIRLDEGSVLAASNMAAALFSMERFAEAEAAARRASDLDPSCSKSRYILGLALAKQSVYSEETLHNLMAAAPKFPKAHLAAAEVLVRTGQRSKAKQQLEDYLATSNPANVDQVKVWISELQ
ncbi:MAG: tetratricopeptide repeat protein [Bryobacteraceae bacterium]|nr:tetratricopeptide repeat protein [Bryobacteraceae bacterium]